MKRHLLIAALAIAVAAPMVAQAPKGWKMRVDRSTSASDPDAAGDIKFVTMGSGGSLRLIEVKWAKTIRPENARSVLRLRAAAKRRRVEATIVHRVARASAKLRTVVPGVSALGVEEFLAGL